MLFSQRGIKMLLASMLYEPGCDDPSVISFFRAALYSCGDVVYVWCKELYREHIDNEEFVADLLTVLSQVPSHLVSADGLNFVRECFTRNSPDIKEAAIGCFQKWSYTDALPLLEEARFKDVVLDDYRVSVIDNLKSIRDFAV